MAGARRRRAAASRAGYLARVGRELGRASAARSVEVLAPLLVIAARRGGRGSSARRCAAARAERAQAAEAAEREELEAAKEAKYREIRDAELDWRTGKLSDADYRALDRRLRAEAVEILRVDAGPAATLVA